MTDRRSDADGNETSLDLLFGTWSEDGGDRVVDDTTEDTVYISGAGTPNVSSTCRTLTSHDIFRKKWDENIKELKLFHDQLPSKQARIQGIGKTYRSFLKMEFIDRSNVFREVLQSNPLFLVRAARNAMFAMMNGWDRTREATRQELASITSVESPGQTIPGTPKKQCSYVMTLFLIRNLMYLSSSRKGQKSCIIENPESYVQAGMKEYWRKWVDNRGDESYCLNVYPVHKKKENCGEAMVLQMFFKDHPEEAKPYLEGNFEFLKDSYMVTVQSEEFEELFSKGNRNEKDPDYDEIHVMPPCSSFNLEGFGCEQWVTQYVHDDFIIKSGRFPDPDPDAQSEELLPTFVGNIEVSPVYL